jgi:hypothetical protein
MFGSHDPARLNGLQLYQDFRHERRFIPLNKSAPNSSVLLKAYAEGGTHRAIERLHFGSLKGEFVVKAVGFGSAKLSRGTPKTVLAVMLPS